MNRTEAQNLRDAVTGMAARYGDACRANNHRAALRRFAALQRLTWALANLAGGAR